MSNQDLYRFPNPKDPITQHIFHFGNYINTHGRRLSYEYLLANKLDQVKIQVRLNNLQLVHLNFFNFITTELALFSKEKDDNNSLNNTTAEIANIPWLIRYVKTTEVNSYNIVARELEKLCEASKQRLKNRLRKALREAQGIALGY